MMVVLPAPVGPTMATIWPGSARRLTPSSTGSPGLYSAQTSSNSTKPVIGGISMASGLSVKSGGVSRMPKMRSPPAIPFWMLVHITEIWAIGWLMRCTYCRKVMIRPSEIVAPASVPSPVSNTAPPTPTTSAIDT